MRRYTMVMGARREVHMVEDIYYLKRNSKIDIDTSNADIPDNETVSRESSGVGNRREMAFATTEDHGRDSSLLDVSQVAEYLRISRSTVYKLIEQHRIPVIRIGRLLRIRKDELDEAIRSMGNSI